MFEINGTKYLTNRQVAERLGLHPGTIRNRRADGRDPIPSVRVGSSVLYPLSAIEAYERSGRR